MIRLADICELVWPLWPDMDGEPREIAEQILAERWRGQAGRLSPSA